MLMSHATTIEPAPCSTPYFFLTVEYANDVHTPTKYLVGHVSIYTFAARLLRRKTAQRPTALATQQTTPATFHGAFNEMSPGDIIPSAR